MTAGAEVEKPGGPTWRRALVLLWLGQVVSHFGDALFHVGIFFLALEVTGSRAGSGLLIALNYLPALAVGPFAGAFVDRHDRRRVMFAAELLRGLAVGAIPLLYISGRLSPAALGAALFILATGTALSNPALKALVPELVPPSHLTTAAAVFQLSEFAALVAGPALAGLVIIPALGTVHLFTLDAATFGVSLLCLLAVAPIARRAAHGSVGTALPPTASGRILLGPPRPGAAPGVWAEVRTGVRAVFGTPTLRLVLLWVAADNLLLTGLAQIATPLLVKETLGLDNQAFAAVQTSFYLGLLAASGAFWLVGRGGRKGPMILLGIVLDGLTLIPLAFCQSLADVQIAMFLHALAVPLIIIPRTVLVQQLLPGPLHGRAFALLNATVFGMTAVSVGMTGLLSEWFPLPRLFLALGTLGVLTGLGGLLSPRLRAAR
jgi:MFS transporter, DHA3 family, macrolide efflux protein